MRVAWDHPQAPLDRFSQSGSMKPNENVAVLLRVGRKLGQCRNSGHRSQGKPELLLLPQIARRRGSR